MPTKQQSNGRAIVPVSVSATLEAFTAMVSAIPGPEDYDPNENLARILQATTWEELSDDQDSLPSGRDMAGRTLLVEKIVRHASTMQDGPGWYLVADAVDVNTGERVKFQTSAGELMAVLVKLHWSDAFPARLTIRTARTSAGRDVVKIAVEGASEAPKPLPGV